MSSNNNNGGGIGISGAVFIVFLVLKLVGIINWSWVWVTAPLWIPLGIGLTMIGLSVGLPILYEIIQNKIYLSKQKKKLKSKSYKFQKSYSTKNFDTTITYTKKETSNVDLKQEANDTEQEKDMTREEILEKLINEKERINNISNDLVRQKKITKHFIPRNKK